MERNEILLVMAICELFGQSKSVTEIERAYQVAAKNLDRYERRQENFHSAHRDQL